MEGLKLVQSADFCGVQCDFYGRNSEVYMTSEQLGECLGYSQAIKSISNLVERNDYLKNKEFSVVTKLMSTDGKQYNTRIFTEDGIYEATFLSKTKKAREFRAFVRQVIKALRKGELRLVGMSEYDRMMVETEAKRVEAQRAEFWNGLAGQYEGTYRQVLQAYATKELAGEFVLPLPKLEAKTYSAGEIGERLGVSGNQVGRLVNQHGLKTEQYGAWFNDKSRYSKKEVQSFRYYESIIPVLEALLRDEDQQKIG